MRLINRLTISVQNWSFWLDNKWKKGRHYNFSANFNRNGQRCSCQTAYPVSLRDLIIFFASLLKFLHVLQCCVVDFFFLTHFCFISVALSFISDRNVFPERLKFRILFRGQFIWKCHLHSSLKKLNPSIFKILWTLNNAKVQIISRFV